MISLCTTLLKLQLICLVSPEFLNECGYKDGVCEGKHITQVVWSIFDHLPGYRCPGSEYSLKYNGPYTYYVIMFSKFLVRTPPLMRCMWPMIIKDCLIYAAL